MEVTFPNGVSVRAVGLAERDSNLNWRAFGLYLDNRWAPTWPATVLDWPDFGVPADRSVASLSIRQAYERAETGEHVEVGCAGGLGRTGTVLACMAVLSGVAASDAVAWVRSHYDHRAVETDEQADWVQWFAMDMS